MEAPKHDLKFGYEFRRTTVDQFFDAGYRGRLDFGSLEDFLSGTLSGGRAARGNSNRYTFQNSHATYLQDTFRWSLQLTFNLGLRWDYFGVIGEKNDLLSNFDPAVGLVQVDQPDFHVSTIATGTTSRRVWVCVECQWRRQDCRARRLGSVLRRFLAGLFCGTTAVQYVQSWTRFQSGWTSAGPLSFSTEPVIEDGVPILQTFST